MTVADNLIEHHGTKGMRWGVRNSPKSSVGRKTNKKLTDKQYGDISRYGFDTSKHKKFVNSRTGKGYMKSTDFMIRHRRKILVARLGLLGITMVATGGIGGAAGLATAARLARPAAPLALDPNARIYNY